MRRRKLSRRERALIAHAVKKAIATYERLTWISIVHNDRLWFRSNVMHIKNFLASYPDAPDAFVRVETDWKRYHEQAKI